MKTEYFSYYRLTGLICVGIFCWSCKQGLKTTGKDAPILTSYTDTAFWQEFHEPFPFNDDPSGLEVRSIAVDPDGDAWIATPVGLFFKKSGTRNWQHAIPEAGQGPSFAVEWDGRAIWMSNWNSVYRFMDGHLERMPGAVSPVSAFCVAPEGVYALGPGGVWLYQGDRCEKKDYPIARSIRDAVTDSNHGLWVATDVGLYHATPASTKQLVNTNDLISAYIRGVSVNGSNVWAGGLGGVTILKDEKKSKVLTPENGIPSINVNCVKRSAEGVMWVGTDVGVVRYNQDSTHSLLFSRRWLLDDKVNDIAFDSAGNAWIATAKGVSVIRRKKMTLDSKQFYFYDVLMRRHIRDPWIAGQCRLPVAGDTSHWEPEDDDNDGEYGGNYLAMESFRYAVTKSDDAKQKAQKSFRFLKFLREVTESDGFFARTIVPADWTSVHDGNRTYTERELAEELVKEPRFKPVPVRWHKSADGKWMWKGDTSSDEICGHMFGYYFYYELVADDNEKKVVGEHVAKIVDHLMAHDLNLTDRDGQATRWGVWSPGKLNRDPEWSPDRSLNSMEMLSFLKLAHYMTGDEKYQREYLRLITEEKYRENMANIPNQNPAWFIYYDVILAAYAYPILIGCEKDPELVKFYEDHIDNWMAQRQGDNNPLINFIYCYSRNKKAGLQASVELLTDTPLDLIDWSIDHTKREDVEVVHNPVLGDIQVNTLQPASIRSTIRWDKNPWAINGGNHHLEREPVFWLLPYWMGRYMKMVE